MRSLEMFPPQKRRRKSWESLNLYAQIAHKLGLYNLKSELEDTALRLSLIHIFCSIPRIYLSLPR